MRSNTRDAARRAVLGAVRGTMHKANDDPLMQANDTRLLHSELLTGVERFQNYGHTSVPLPPDPDGKKAAETLAVFLNGNRSHPIVIAVDDRRHRPKKLKPGESALYDDQGQQVYVSRDGIVITGGSNKLPVTIKVGNASLKVEDGKITETVDQNTIILTASKVLLGKNASAAVKTTDGDSSVVFAAV